MNVVTLPIDSVRVPEGRRSLRNVEQLADSIREVGLLNPITVTPGRILLTGYHRLEACKLLQWSEIPAQVLEAEASTENLPLLWQLAEIDENLIRNDLDVLERSEQEARRQDVYEQLHPETKHGGAPGAAGGGKQAKGERISSFAEDTASKTGVSPRSVQQDLQIAKKILPEVKAVVRGTQLADSKTDLLQLARLKPEEQKAVAETLKSEPMETVKQAIRQVRHEQRLQEFAEPAPLGSLGERFSVVYADPPWTYDFCSDDADAIENHYPPMTLDAICALPVQEIAARDCVLFLWATSPKLKEAMRVIDAWGFTYKTCSVWVKDWISMGYYFRQRHELLLVATRGEPPTPMPSDRPDSVQESPKREHSRKPDCYYDLIEAMYPGASKVELFCRHPREEWSCWGNECGGTNDANGSV